MIRLIHRGLIAQRSRLALTVAALALGVGFMTTTITWGQAAATAVNRLAADRAGDADLIVTANTASPSGPDQRTALPASTIQHVSTLDGVATAEGFVVFRALLSSDNVPVGEGHGWVRSWRPTIDGPAPEGTDYIVLDAADVADNALGHGSGVEVAGPAGTQRLRLAGTSDLDPTDAPEGAALAVVSPDTAQALAGVDGFTGIAVIADEDTDHAALAAAVRRQVPADLRVMDPVDFGRDFLIRTDANLDVLTTGLQILGAAALAVSLFLIHNTVTITTTQRTRELALMRTVGASSRRLSALLVAETAVTATAAALIGAAAAALASRALAGLVALAGIQLPSDAPLTVAGLGLPAAAAVVLAVVAALRPIRRAARLSPLAALRQPDHAARPPRGTRAAAAALAVAAALLAIGGVTQQLGLIAPSALLLAGVLVVGASPLLHIALGPFTTIARRFAGTPAFIGARDSRCNIRRTAATTLPIVGGLGLVVVIIILAASLRATATSAVEEGINADYFLATANFDPIPGSLADDVRAQPAFDTVASLRLTSIETPPGSPQPLVAITAEHVDVLTIDIVAGTPERLADNQILISQAAARSRNLDTGDAMPAQFPTGRVELEIGGIYETNQLGHYLISTALHDQHTPSPLDNVILVQTAADAAPAAIADQLRALTAEYPGIVVRDPASFRDGQAQQIDQLLGVVIALLAITLIVAIAGVANTSALSLVVRRHEIALLRAIGMDHTELGTMIATQGAITGVIGTAAAVFFGAALALAVVRGLAPLGLDHTSIPAATIAAAALLTIGAAATASLVPLRRRALPVPTEMTTAG